MTGMVCLICRQAETIYGCTSVTFARDEINLVVNNVPAHVCPSCGEAHVEEEVAIQLLQDAEEMSEAGILDVVREFKLV